MPSRKISLSELPSQLRHIPQPPKHLYAKGIGAPIGTRYLTVVGSRMLSPYGRAALTTLIEGLRGYPISVVSGLALGADGCAHAAALRAGLHTIAIPGSGLRSSVLGPRLHVPLAEQILASGGQLLSEHQDDHVAVPADFPSRNRIMVGLAHAVLLVEAAPSSGSLISARLAGEYGRELLCVPHRIGDLHGYGASVFLRIGATYVTEPAHILYALGLEPADSTPFFYA